LLSTYIWNYVTRLPQRDVLHINLHTDSWQPWLLVGETPLLAVMADNCFW
jgi:hypothetical protein